MRSGVLSDIGDQDRFGGQATHARAFLSREAVPMDGSAAGLSFRFRPDKGSSNVT
jgi:hypothetical protein